MTEAVKFGGGGSFAAYMERRRRGVASHLQRKYAQKRSLVAADDTDDEPNLESIDSGREFHSGGDFVKDDTSACINRRPHGCLEGMTASPEDTPNDAYSTQQHGEICNSVALFEGCHFYIDGMVRPYAPLLQREPCENAALHAHEKLLQIIVKHGGTIEIHLSDYVTHYIAERVALGCSKWWNMRQRGGVCRQYAVVTPAYVFECHIQNRRLPEREFVPEVLRMRDGMITLTQYCRQSESSDAKNRNISTPKYNEVKNEEAEYIDQHLEGYIHDELSSDTGAEDGRGGIIDDRYEKVKDGCIDPINVERSYNDLVSNHTSASNDLYAIAGIRNDDTSAGDGRGTNILAPAHHPAEKHDKEHSAADSGIGGSIGMAGTYAKSIVDGADVSSTVQIPQSSTCETEANNNDKTENGVIDTFGVEEYYKHSRLHLLGTWKTNVESKFHFEPFRPLKNGILTDGKIMHIDMDAFFVSVALRDRPHLRKAPVAISHGTGRNSASEIATCNYEARKFGVCKGMWVKEALRRCPSLKFVAYDFNAITETAMKILTLIAKVTRRVYSASCDEHYLECFLGSDDKGIENYLIFADKLANMIESETGCPLSVGIGGNMMMAKLASQKSKAIKHGINEASMGYVHKGSVCAVVDIEAFMSSVALHELPGVGHRAMSLLRSCGYNHCRDINSKEELQLLLGDKMGQTVYQFCQGRDFRDMYTAEKRSQILKNKTISAAINYGVRVKAMEQVHEYIRQLVRQTWGRVKTTVALIMPNNDRKRASDIPQANIVLKIRVRSPEASVEPEKYMGCGMCDEFSASVTGELLFQKSLFDSLLLCWSKITSKNKIRLEDLRGIAIAINRVKIATAKENNTLDKYLVSAALVQPPNVTCPVDNGPITESPGRTDSKVMQKKDGTMLRFLNGAHKSSRTPTKRKRTKRKLSGQPTLYDMLQSPDRCTGSKGSPTPASSNPANGASNVECKTDHTPKRDVQDILKIVPSISNVWICSASSALIERRLKSIKRGWPMYTTVVAFYRELFTNYATILNTDSTMMSASCNGVIECDNGKHNSDAAGDIDAIASEQCMNVEEGINGADKDDGAIEGSVTHGVRTSPQHQTAEGNGDAQEVTTAARFANTGHSQNGAPHVTLFAMRRVCRACRTRFYKTFDISMLQDIQCPLNRCVLPRLRALKRCEAGVDCTAQAVTMVICILVYAVLLRVVVQLARQRRFDLLQTFLDVSMRESMQFCAPFVGAFDRSLQRRFFAEAHLHLSHIYGLTE
ncbi:ImpB/MucB/SamB family protein [Babesia divergens]|uniref:ImpB/MucB/SamB family protein n=1 Tax=Babesia divergens TaxID=32595 RepID=A0AAD9GH95_BABDI|nr:ImpB/MucB/SamB family protein [Babesia divergens]